MASSVSCVPSFRSVHWLGSFIGRFVLVLGWLFLIPLGYWGSQTPPASFRENYLIATVIRSSVRGIVLTGAGHLYSDYSITCKSTQSRYLYLGPEVRTHAVMRDDIRGSKGGNELKDIQKTRAVTRISIGRRRGFRPSSSHTPSSNGSCQSAPKRRR